MVFDHQDPHGLILARTLLVWADDAGAGIVCPRRRRPLSMLDGA
jgi:hypothetical protein